MSARPVPATGRADVYSTMDVTTRTRCHYKMAR
jgi:hypothetical protein